MKPTRVIELVEWEKPKTVYLTVDEAEVLHRLEKRLDVHWTSSSEVTISGKAGYVGSASLSEATEIIIRPHIPVASVLELACYAYGLEPPDKTLSEKAQLDNTGPGDWLALLLTIEIERLLALGLRSGYRDLGEEIPYIRGRIDFSALRWGNTKPGLVPCQFEDFVVDTDENRILYGTLEILSTSSLSPAYRKRLDHALAAFRQVALVRPILQMFDKARLNRLNSYYQPALTLCRLVLESAGIDLESGDVSTTGFFFSMSDVFEKTLEQTLREQFGRANVHCQAEYNDRIRQIKGASAIPVTFVPDNVIGPRDAPWLIVDAKYKKPTKERWRGQYLHNDNLYQAFTYAAALDAQAMLVYPKVNQDIDVTFKAGGHEVRVMTVDLGQSVQNAASAMASAFRVSQH